MKPGCAFLSFGSRCWLCLGHLLLECSADAAANPACLKWASSASPPHKTAHRAGFVPCYLLGPVAETSWSSPSPMPPCFLSNQTSHPVPSFCALSPELVHFSFLWLPCRIWYLLLHLPKGLPNGSLERTNSPVARPSVAFSGTH